MQWLNEKRKGNIKKVPIMVGSGRYSHCTWVEKGTKIMIEDGTVIEAGLTSDEFNQRINQQIDEMDTMEPKLNKIKQKVLNYFNGNRKV